MKSNQLIRRSCWLSSLALSAFTGAAQRPMPLPTDTLSLNFVFNNTNLIEEEIAELGFLEVLPPLRRLNDGMVDTTVFLSDSVAWSIVYFGLEDSLGDITMEDVYCVLSHKWPHVETIQVMVLYQTEDNDLDYEYEVIRPDFLECRWGREEDSDEEESTWLMDGNRSIFIRPNGQFTDQFGDPLRR